MSEIGEGMDWGPIAQAHRTALELLWDAVSQSYHDRCKLEDFLEEKISLEVRSNLGNLNRLIQEHGLLGDTISEAIMLGKSTAYKLHLIKKDIGTFRDKLTAFADAAKVSKEYPLCLISQVLDVEQDSSKKASKQLNQVKLVLRQGVPPVPTETLTPPQLTQMQGLSRTGSFDADTPLGSVQIGGSNTQLIVNMLFSIVRDIQAKVDMLNKQSKTRA